MKTQNQFIGKFAWPFCSYDVLMPKQVEKDLFEWLYLSLIVCKNREQGISQDSYRKNTQIEVRQIIRNKFSALIDDITLEHIIMAAEEDFVLKDMTKSEDHAKVLKPDTFSFLETYDDLFSSQVSIQRVFVDSITGSVVPCFKDMGFPKEAKDEDILRIPVLKKDKPSKLYIKKALQMFNRLNKLGSNAEDIISEIDNELIDPDAEVDYEVDDEFDSNEEVETNKLSEKDFSVTFIDNTRITYNLEIEVYTDGSKLFINTPFDRDITYKWINKMLGHARAVSAELDNYLKVLEKQYCLSDEREDEQYAQYIFTKKDVAKQLTYCESLYRLIEQFPSEFNNARKLVIKIDKYLASRDEGYFTSIGKYLECLIDKLKDASDIDSRQYVDYTTYCEELDTITQALNVYGRPMCSNNIYYNWQKGWKHFKADVTSLFLNNDKMRSNKELYNDFVKDIYNLYDLRNSNDHYNEDDNCDYSAANIDKLFKVTRVLLELV